MKPWARSHPFAFFMIITVFSFVGIAHASTPPPTYYPPPALMENLCPATTLQVCGESFAAPASISGGFQTFIMPDRFVSNSVTFQCIGDGYHMYYKVADNNAAHCTLKTCKPGYVSVCNAQALPVEAEISVGDRTKLTIPAHLLAQNNALPPPDLSAACVIHEGAAHYELTNEQDLSCTIFACQGKELSACDSTALIPGPADLGTVLLVQTNNHRLVTAECMGSEGFAPAYKNIEQNCN